MLHLICIVRAKAKEAGFSNEGALFGVPAWFDGDIDDNEFFIAAPKIPVLHVWCWQGAAA